MLLLDTPFTCWLYSRLEQPTMAQVKVVRAHERETEVASGAMTRMAGVSRSLTGAEGIHLALATTPPGARSTPHWHTNCESAIYVLRGHGKFYVGKGLTECLDIGPGDMIYVPAGAIHQPVNESLSEPLEMVVAPNAPVELVEEYDPSSDT